MKITKKLEIEIPEPKPAPKDHKYVVRGWGWKSDGDVDFTFYTDFYGWVCYENSPATGHPETYYLEIVRTHREDGTPLDIDPIPEMPENVERVEYFGDFLTEEDMGDADSYIWCDYSGWDLGGLEDGKLNDPPVGFANERYARVWYKKEEPKKKTLEETLRLLPDWLADRAISQIDKVFNKWRDGDDLDSALIEFAEWGETNEKYPFWNKVYHAIKGNEIDHSKLPDKLSDNPEEPKTTQLSDLIGEDGQKICYLINRNKEFRQFNLTGRGGGLWGDTITSRLVLSSTYRWSHNPLTKFEDANEFVFEEGGTDE